MSAWLLDTDIVSYALKGVGGVADAIQRHVSSSLAISSITCAELCYGAARKGSAQIQKAIDSFTKGISVISFDQEAARRYAQLMADLEAQGIGIDDFDGMIAGHALATGRTLVTHNRKHFERIKGLRLADWY